jgi:putative aminopeptidase FrvX
MKKMKESIEIEVEREPDSMLTKVKKKGVGPMSDRQLLVKMYEIFSPSGGEHAMVNFVSAYLTEKGIEHEIDSMGNIYCRNHIVGENRIIINAHMDTVASAPAKIIAEKTEDGDVHVKSSNNQVIGGDDKNGVFVALKLLMDKRIKQPLTVLLCVAEETGCNGSEFAMTNHKEYFDDCVFCITVDRRGNTDIITQNFDYQLCSDEMEKTLNEWGKDFGLRTTQGSISDVSNIVTALEINGINLFAGYYNAHSGNEYTSIKDLSASLRFARYLLPMLRSHFKDNPEAMKYKPKSAYRAVTYGGVRGYSGWDYTNYGMGAYSGKVLSDSQTDKLMDAHEIFLDVIDDIESITQLFFGEIAECDFKMSNSGKSLIFPDSYIKHKEEWDQLHVYLECECVNGGDVRIAVADLEDYDMYYKYKSPEGDDDWNA